MTEAQILLALHQGVYNATKEYEYWSGGILLHECAGESFMVSHMATSAIKAIKKYSSKFYLRLEYLGRKIKEDQSISHPGCPPKFFRSAQRLDMAILDSQYQLKFAIEAKCSYSWADTYNNDLKRLVTIYNKFHKKRTEHQSSLQSCLFMIFVYGTGKNIQEADGNLKKNIKNYKDKAKEAFSSLKTYEAKFYFSESNKSGSYRYTGEDDDVLVYKTTSLCCIIK